MIVSRQLSRLLPCVLAVALTGCNQRLAPAPPPQAAMVATTLVSPWDASPTALTAAPFDCGGPVPIGADLTVTNNLGSNRISESVKQAIYAESDAALHDLTHQVVTAADTFRRTGSQAAAQCVATLLTAAAANHGMDGFMASGDAWQEQNQALRATAVAYLKVRGALREANALSPDDNALIASWMDDIARRERDNVENGPCGAGICPRRSHTGLSIAAAAAAAGIVANDHALFHWAIDQYRTAVSSIDARGMLHYDTHGKYALSDNIVSAGDLVQIAELGEVNGEPLYAFDNGHIHLLIHTVARGLVDPGPFADASGAEQSQHATIETWQVSWASVYNSRFPDPVLTTLLQQVGPGGSDMWGGEPGGAQ